MSDMSLRQAPIASRATSEAISAGYACYDTGSAIALIDGAVSYTEMLKRPLVAITGAASGDPIAVASAGDDVLLVAGAAVAIGDYVVPQVATGKWVPAYTYTIPPGGFVGWIAMSAASGDGKHFRAAACLHRAQTTIPGDDAVTVADAAATLTAAEHAAALMTCTPTANRILTTRTALQLIADFLPWDGAVHEQTLVNAAAATYTLTLAGGTDVTARGSSATGLVVAPTETTRLRYTRLTSTTVLLTVGG